MKVTFRRNLWQSFLLRTHRQLHCWTRFHHHRCGFRTFLSVIASYLAIHSRHIPVLEVVHVQVKVYFLLSTSRLLWFWRRRALNWRRARIERVSHRVWDFGLEHGLGQRRIVDLTCAAIFIVNQLLWNGTSTLVKSCHAAIVSHHVMHLHLVTVTSRRGCDLPNCCRLLLVLMLLSHRFYIAWM